MLKHILKSPTLVLRGARKAQKTHSLHILRAFRRRRQAQGIAKAKSAQKYRGRAEDAKRNTAIMKMLEAKQSWSSIIAATGCSRSTLSRLNKRIAA